jgi:DNA processing protein
VETAALVALLREGGRPWARYVVAARKPDPGGVSALAVLEQELGLLSYESLANAELELQRWQASGYQVLTSAHADYPDNLRVIDNRPPLLFVAGDLSPADRRSVAVIGTRQPSELGRELAREVSQALALAGYTVVSGLAAGIDAEAHRGTLGLLDGECVRSARTLAILGTGLDHVYPPEHAELQERIAREGALVSQFWPEATPTRNSFPARNAVMSGMTLGSVIVEASEHSGTRIQARHALAQGRVVVLMPPTLEWLWARELVDQPGVVVAQDAADVVGIFRR